MSWYFTLFYCVLDLSCGECNVITLYFLCCSVNGSVCPVCCVSDSVCELLGKQFAIYLGVVVIYKNILNLIQHIEDEHKESMISGTAFVAHTT